jgi:outer membrane protein assembly complex protein YaeT
MAVSADTERLDLETPVSWTFEKGTLAHTPLRLRGPRGNATLAATFASIGDEVRFAADGSGTIDLSVANPFLAGAGVVGGTLTFDARLARTEARWTAGGTASVVDGRFVLRSPELALSDLRATLRADGERIELVEATAAMGDGKIVAQGQAAITDTDVDLDLRLQAERVPLEYPEGLQTRSSGAIRLSGTGERPRITGDLVVHRAIYERELDRTAAALDRAGVRVAGTAGRGSLADRTELDLALRLDDGVRIATSTATLVIDGTVRADGTLAAPEVDGSLSVREGGTIRVSRALVRLQGGRIELRDYPTRPPEVQIQGATQVTGVRIDMALSGSLDDVRMNLSSSNRGDLSQGDLATLILTGRTTTDAAAESGAIVGEEVAAALGQALDRRLGGPLMIDVSRDESLIVEDTDPSQRLNIGVPINERLYVIYSRSLDSEALRWIVDFRPGGDFRVRGIANDDGSEALEVSHRFGFHVWSRKYRTARPKDVRLTIGEVAVIGAPPGTEAELRNRLKLKGGAEFDYFRGEQAAARAREWLVTRGYLTAAIEVREISRGTDVDLTVRINPGPHVTVEWRGDDPGGAEKKHVNAGWGTFLPLQDTAERLARDVDHRLRARGYYNAVVTAEVRSDNGAAHAIFDVRRGEKGSGVDLVFEGNASIPDATLAAVIPDRDNAAFFALLEADGAQRLPTAIRLAYFREGFLQAEVGAPVAHVDPGSRRLAVTIPIREGPRATVLAFDVPPEVTMLEGAVAPAFELRIGDRFRFDAYNADRARLRTWYRNEGFPEARVQGVVEPTPDGVVVRLGAEPGPRVRVADVRTSREGHTRAGVIQRAVGMTEGDLARASNLDEARERLTETGVFRSVDVRLASSPGQENVRDVVVDLSERSDINMEYSLRYTTAGSSQVGGTPSDSDAGLQVGAATEFVNPFGWAARYRLYGLYGAERRLLGGRYESATFFGRRWETQVFVFDDEDRVEDIESLSERVRGITFQQTKRWRNTIDGRRLQDGLRLQWGYTYKRIRYTSLETSETLGGLRGGPILSLIGDSRDSVTDPHRGVFWSVGTETALEALGSDVDYFKIFGQVFFYTPLTPRITWAQGYRVGVVPGDDPLLLLESRFTAGGASSVRGFDEKALGPTGPEGEEIGGQAVTIINQELRFPLWKRLFGGVFYDAGNAFLLAGDMSLGALRQSAGAGLRLMFPFGPVRLDWSSVIDPREGEKRSRLHFSIGHVF